MYQMNTKCTKWLYNIPNLHKIFQMAIKYINIFQSKAIQNLPKSGILVWKQTIWQPCIWGNFLATYNIVPWPFLQVFVYLVWRGRCAQYRIVFRVFVTVDFRTRDAVDRTLKYCDTLTNGCSTRVTLTNGCSTRVTLTNGCSTSVTLTNGCSTRVTLTIWCSKRSSRECASFAAHGYKDNKYTLCGKF
jgi:hypothetical protein